MTFNIKLTAIMRIIIEIMAIYLPNTQATGIHRNTKMSFLMKASGLRYI